MKKPQQHALVLSIVAFAWMTFSFGMDHTGASHVAERGHAETRYSAPSPIEHFSADLVSSGVLLNWSVVSEKDIEGFSIYRSNQETGNFVRVNEDGLLEAYLHTLTDDDVEGQTTYRYALGVVMDDGSELLSHAVEVTTGSDQAYRE